MKRDNIFEQDNWKHCRADQFWNEVAHSDHLVQIYENEEVLLNSLVGFSESGFRSGDTVIIVARESRLDALDKRLKAHGFDVEELKSTYQFVPLNAHEVLSYFMKDGWPDEKAFNQIIKGLVSLAYGKPKNKLRIYGEMVSILMAQGYNGATVQLEHLWNKFCESEGFCLFCSYPKHGFNQYTDGTYDHICCAHTKMISGVQRSRTDIFYKETERKQRKKQG